MPRDNINTAFTRRLLSLVHADIRKDFPEIEHVVKAAAVTRTMRNQFFIQIETPHRPMFNFDCEASDAYEARFKGWHAFRRKYGVDAHA